MRGDINLGKIWGKSLALGECRILKGLPVMTGTSGEDWEDWLCRRRHLVWVEGDTDNLYRA